MTLARWHAWISLVVWGAILIGLVAALAVIGIERFSAPDNNSYRLATAAILLPGYLLGTWTGWRQRRGQQCGELDERDERVALKASQITLLVVALALFGVCVALWEAYKYGNGAPAGWFYVLAYLTVVLLSLIHAAARLICDATATVDG